MSKLGTLLVLFRFRSVTVYFEHTRDVNNNAFSVRVGLFRYSMDNPF